MDLASSTRSPANPHSHRVAALAVLIVTSALAGGALAQEVGKSLEDKLNNPLANLISVPFQNNVEFGGPDNDGTRYRLNIQPVIPFSISDGWNLVTRTIVPISYQDGFSPVDERNFELGDVNTSLFFSPKASHGGLTWGVGPIISIPLATGHAGVDQWGLGPTALLLEQKGVWTYGLLASQLWGLGDDSDSDVSSMLLQPFLSKKIGGGYTVGANLEATYDWPSKQWTVPAQISLTKLTTIGKQPVSFQGGIRYFFDKPSGGSDWGLRLQLTLPLAKG